VRCVSLSLYVVLRFWNQLCSSQALLLWSWVSLCLITGGLFLCLVPFLWGKVSDLSAGSLLSECCDSLLISFQFCSVIWLWMLLTGSGDELCGPLPALFQVVAYHQPAVGPSVFPAFIYWKLLWRSAPCFPRLLQCAYSNSAPLLCVSFQFLVYCSVFFFFAGRGISLPRIYAGLSQGCLGKSTWCLVLTCWSAECLPSRFGAGVWQHGSPPVFSV
jgi:hypothetical protein